MRTCTPNAPIDASRADGPAGRRRRARPRRRRRSVVVPTARSGSGDPLAHHADPRPWGSVLAPASQPPRDAAPVVTPIVALRSRAGRAPRSPHRGVSRATVGRLLHAQAAVEAQLRALDPSRRVHRSSATPGELLPPGFAEKVGRIRRPRHRVARHPPPAGPMAPARSTRTSASMTPRAWPMWRSCPMMQSAPPRLLSAAPYAPRSPPWVCPSGA